jgi:hypothetical protein
MAVRRRCASNQGSFYDRFDAVVLLRGARGHAPAHRDTVSHPFAKDAHERQRILADLDAVEPLLQATSTVEIVTIPATKVVDALESIAQRADGGSVGRSTRP